jgi:catechol 2,3-dioxygenase-like lactoylglutathione lyase family enzyme
MTTEPQFRVTSTVIVRDIARSVAFYRDVLGATVVDDGEPTYVQLGNTWIIIALGGGPTDPTSSVAMTSGHRAVRSLSPNRKSTRRRCGATCVIRTVT